MYQKGLNILRILERYDYDGYIVGGFPRDRYLNRYSRDIDICTNALPDKIIEIFPNSDNSNIKYGNIIVDGIQITTYRREKYTKDRYPEIEYINSLEEDLRRRDFIINTLCIDYNGNYIDLYNAKADLDNKIIRTVGNPFDKLKEDPLRILRAIRFATILNFDLDNELSSAIKKYSYLIRDLSYAKRKLELNKILNSSNNKKGIYLILEHNLDSYLDIYNLDKIDYNKEILPQIDIYNKYL